jgi:hypothetical protein
MNCPKHIRETEDPEAVKAAEDRIELEELEEILAGKEVEEDYLS